MTNDHLSQLPSEEFYKKLGDDAGVETSFTECDQIETDSSSQEKTRKVCHKLAKNLTFLENERANNDLFYYKRCFDLNFWLYKQIHEVPNSGETVSDLHVEKFHKLWKIIIYKISSKLYDVCMPESKKYHAVLYKHLKDLFDFIENYDAIEKEIEEAKETEEQQELSKYCKYVKEKIPLYEAFEDLCKKKEINKCTHCIKNYQNYDPYELLDKLKCGDEIKKKDDKDDSIKQEIKRLQESPEDNPVLYSTNDKAYDASDLIPYLMDLLKDGLSYIGIEKIHESIPFLQNIISLEKFSVIVASTILIIGGLILYSILHKCFPHFSCLNILRRRRRRGMNAFDPAQQLMPGMLDFQNPMFGNMQYGAPYGMPYQAMQYGAPYGMPYQGM